MMILYPMFLTLRSSLVTALASVALFATPAAAEPVKVLDVKDPWAHAAPAKVWRSDPIDPWAKKPRTQRTIAIERREVIDPWKDTVTQPIPRVVDVINPW